MPENNCWDSVVLIHPLSVSLNCTCFSVRRSSVWKQCWCDRAGRWNCDRLGRTVQAGGQRRLVLTCNQMKAWKTTIHTGLTEYLSLQRGSMDWGGGLFFNYRFRKKPFGQDVMSYCRPSTVTTVIYRKSPCSFLCPGGGFQQLRERSFKWGRAWGRKRSNHWVSCCPLPACSTSYRYLLQAGKSVVSGASGVFQRNQGEDIQVEFHSGWYFQFWCCSENV